MIELLIVAGHETTVNLIGKGMAALLRRESELIEMAIEEFLRYEGLVEMATTRYASKNVQIGEALIQRVGTVIVILPGENHDPIEFQNLTALVKSHESDKHQGLGYGVHYCLGASLARLEAKITIKTLLKRLPTIRLSVFVEQLKYTESEIVCGLAGVGSMG